MSAPDRWEVATDPSEVHALLVASDQAQARGSGTPAPPRRPSASEHLVRAGATHLLRRDGRPVAMFTVTGGPPHGVDESRFGARARALYLQRLALAPGASDTDPTLGLRCVRRALRLADERAAEVLRCEVNPDLTATRRLFALLGFVQHGPTLVADGVSRAYLQRPVRATAPSRGRRAP